jgi:hypothetical protein
VELLNRDRGSLLGREAHRAPALVRVCVFVFMCVADVSATHACGS